MSAPYLIPFNFQPATTSSGSGTYTVPAGRYARVTVTLNASVFMSSSSATNVGNWPPGGDSVTDSITATVWAKAGDVIAFSSSTPSTTSSSPASTSLVVLLHGATSQSVSLNGINFAQARASTTLWTSNNTSSTVTIGGEVNNHYYAEEYNVIS